MSVVDDFGRYYAKPELLRAACFPLKLDKVGNPDIGKWILETREAALVRTYTVDGKAYLELVDFRQQVRAKDSKFPQPSADDVQSNSECIADAQQVNGIRTLVSYSYSNSETESSHRAPRSGLNGAFAEFWTAYPKKKSKGDAEKAWIKIKPDEQLTAQIIAAVGRATTSADWKKDGGQFIPHPATWLNAKGWEDEIFAKKPSPEYDPDRMHY